MEKDVHEFILKSIAQIQQNRLAIFCGAGISFHSGIPLVVSLLEEIYSRIDLNDIDKENLAKSGLPFEAIMETIKLEADIDEILDIFKSGKPNTNHFLIAELAKAGYVQNIVTTNFDLNIENAMQNIGMVRGFDFRVYSSKMDFDNINWIGNGINLIKIHGCILEKEELGITMSHVASKTVSKNRISTIIDFFSKSNNNNVLVLGYSCSDIFDISPAIESLRENSANIFFIQHPSSSSTAPFVEPISKKLGNNPFKFYNGLRLTINTDDYVFAVWGSILQNRYDFKQSNSSSWKENVKQWIERSIASYTEGIKPTIGSRLLYEIGQFKSAIHQNQKAISIALYFNEIRRAASALGNLSMAFNALGRTNEAESTLNTSIALCSKIGHYEGVISQLQAIANVYKNQGRLQDAEAKLLEALKLIDDLIVTAVDKNEIKYLRFSKGTALGNLGEVYVVMGKTKEAIITQEQALIISYELGNKQAESTQLASLGRAFFELGDIKKSSEYLQKAVDIARSIGNKQNEGKILINLCNIYALTGDFGNLASCLKEASDIAKKIGSQELENQVIVIHKFYTNKLH